MRADQLLRCLSPWPVRVGPPSQQWEITGLQARPPNCGQPTPETSRETQGACQRTLAPASPATPGPGLAVP